MVRMPQRQRHNTGGGTGGAELPLLNQGIIEAQNNVTTRCCIPMQSNCVKAHQAISIASPVGCVRVICNNENCTVGNYMHKECFAIWEKQILASLKSCGRARSWSEKQRCQNLWTKRGYDLAFKSCNCLCGRGRLRKDLDFIPINPQDDNRNKKKKRNRNNQRPVLVTVGIPLSNQRNRTNSLSSTGSSPPSDVPVSPHHQPTMNFNYRNRHGSGGSIIGGKVVSSTGGILGNTCMFARRPNFCSFNILPRTKINSYDIKMEDDSNHGNDETRGFILTTLAAQKIARTPCVLCQQILLVFDRYPLIDGTFFLTPIEHSRNVIPVVIGERKLYLTAVCLGCLQGNTPEVRCLHCFMPWDGSQLILGTMYSYDIFAATPCCVDRLRCSRCQSVVISPDRKLNFFSEYSLMRSCPNCGLYDHHFVKPISSAFTIDNDNGRL